MWWLHFMLKNSICPFLECNTVWSSESNIFRGLTWRFTHLQKRPWQVWNAFFVHVASSEDGSAMTWSDNSDFNLKRKKKEKRKQAVCAQINVQPNPLFPPLFLTTPLLTGGARQWQPGPVPGTLLSDGGLPRPEKKKIPVCTRDSQNRTTWWLCSDGRHYDWVCCHSLSSVFKLCGGSIKSASSLQPSMLQGSSIKSHSQKHSIHQLRTNYVDVIGWSAQSGNVPSCPWSRRKPWNDFSDQGAGNWFISLHHRESTAITARRRFASAWRTPVSSSSLPHIPTLQWKSQLKVEWHDIPHAIYFCPPPPPAFIISFSPRVLVCVHLWKETVFYRVIFRCLPCGHMKVTVPGCVCVHIDARKTCVRASRTGQVDRTWLTRPQQGTRVPKQAHILNCLHSCQSGLAGAELVGAGSKQGADAAESIPPPTRLYQG